MVQYEYRTETHTGFGALVSRPRAGVPSRASIGHPQRNATALYCIVLYWIVVSGNGPGFLWCQLFHDRSPIAIVPSSVKHSWHTAIWMEMVGLGWAGLGWAVRYVPCLLGTVFSTVFHPFTTPGSSCSPPRLSSTYVLVAVVVRFPCCCKNASTGAIP